MPDHGIRVQLGQARRADHDRGRARRPGNPRVFDAGAQAIGRCSGNHRYALSGLVHHGFEHHGALALSQSRDLACYTKGGQAVHSARDKQVDHAAKTFMVNRAVLQKRRWQNGKNAFQFHDSSLKYCRLFQQAPRAKPIEIQ